MKKGVKLTLIFLILIYTVSFVSAACSDSDNGLNYFNYGEVQSGKNTYKDKCINNENLKEYSCKKFLGFYYSSSKVYSCPDGCSNGACSIACAPDCFGKSCGNDGCKGSCGTCISGQDCINGLCKANNYNSVSDSLTSPESFCADCVSVTLGPAESVLGPVADRADFPFFVINAGGGIYRGYTSNRYTFLYEGTNLNNLVSKNNIVIGPGAKGNYDECGAWLAPVAYKEGNIIRGWYHAEKFCNYTIWQTHMSIAYAESYDNGKTFTKVGYPNNLILSQTTIPMYGNSTGVGNPTIVKFQNYYYAYIDAYIDELKKRIWGVARSSVSDGGKPGTWYKYYNGSFSEPGIGGNLSELINLTGTSVYLFEPVGLISVGASRKGFFLSFSKDGINWQKLQDPLLYSDYSRWTRPDPKELISYPSFVSSNPDLPLNNQFYLYYTYLNPGETFDNRYIVKRLVTIDSGYNPVTPQVKVALSRYYNQNKNDHWVTTTLVLNNYKFEQTLGYVMTKPYPETIPVYDGYISIWDDHIVATQGEIDANSAFNLRTLGWIWKTEQPNTVPIYRCFNDSIKNHFISLQSNCENLGIKEFLLGYVYPTTPVVKLTCTDSDGGRNKFVKGTVSLNDGRKYTDSCDTANSKVTEYFCVEGGEYDKVDVGCVNGCRDGACINLSLGGAIDNCTDSDNGKNYYVKGTTSDNTGEGPFTDYCNNLILYEYYCKTNPVYATYENYNCPNGCSNGACIDILCTPKTCAGLGKQCGTWNNGCGGSVICPNCASGQSCSNGTCVGSCTPNCAGKSCGDNGCGGSCGTCSAGKTCSKGLCIDSATCTDSDGGRNKFTKGTIVLSDGRSFTDICDVTNKNVTEYFCIQGGGYEKVDVGCVNGCSNGACINITCISNCTGKSCGDDGCSGACGTCSSGKSCVNGLCVNSATCTDSDGGKDYFVRGTVTDRGTNYIDLCYEADKKIFEYFCKDGGNYGGEWYNCTDGCSSGACNFKYRLKINDGETETIEGHNISVIVKDTYSVTITIDGTTETQHEKHGCMEDGRKINTAQICINDVVAPNAGAAGYIDLIIFKFDTCTDSDGGRNKFVKGTVILSDGRSFTDSCDVTNKNVTEYFCIGGGGYDKVDVGCVNGCSNSACLTSLGSEKPSLWSFIKELFGF